MEPNDKVIGERLKQLRSLAKLTQEILAKDAQVSRASLIFWENGKQRSMTRTSANKLIAALKKHGVECTIQWLLTGLGPPPYSSTSSIKDEKKDSFNEFINLKAKEEEVDLFLAASALCVVTSIADNAMFPVYHKGDIVGGVWEKSDTIKTPTICIVNLDEKLQVRQVSPTNKKNFFNLSFLNYEITRSEPFSLSFIKLEKLAPIIRMWR